MENLVQVFWSRFDLSTGIIILGTVLIVVIIKKIFATNHNHPDEHAYRGYENAERIEGNWKKGVINEIQKLREKEPLPPHYPNAWFAVMASEELQRNQVKEAVFCGKEVVLWRGENGVAYVADAHCPHLGAHLGVEGEVRGNCIQCPFHHWSFDGSQAGKLVSIPYSAKLIEHIQLKMWETKEVNGYIMVWHSSQGNPPTWEPQQLDQLRDWYSLSNYNYHFYTHVEDIVENSADEQHFGPIHGNTNQKGKTLWSRLLSALAQFDKFTLEWVASDEAQNRHIVSMSLSCRILLFGVFPVFTSKILLKQDGPGLLYTHQSSPWGSTCMVQAVTPLQPLKTRMTQKVFSSNRFMQLESINYKNEIIQQISNDSFVWNRKVRKMNPLLTKEDQKIQAFRRWFSQFYCKSTTEETL